MPAEERKVATLLFADLVGSTALAGDEDPERVRAVLDRFYDAMEAEVEQAGGTIEKFAGDAVMAAFGAPAALEDHAERAVRAALGMQRRLEAAFGGRLGLRIGVNTGEVVVGRPREGSSFATGDTVNVCARLEQAAQRGEILVGARTLALTRGAFEFGELKRVDAKGKPDGVLCAAVLKERVAPGSARELRAGVFVGRQDELARLQAAYSRVSASRRPELIAVVGDAGVGKSRLLRELWNVLAAAPQQPVLWSGRCPAYGRGRTYWALGEVLRQHFRLQDGAETEHMAELLEGRDGLAWTLGMPPPRDLHPLHVRDRLQNDWIEFVSEIAAERPVVLLVEDLHWSEPDLEALLCALVERVDGALLVLQTARPEWTGAATERVELDTLDGTAESALLDALLGVECPARLRTLVAERAAGNPFFTEELVATLTDLEVIRWEGDHRVFKDFPPGLTIPDTVQAVLAARIDLLPPAEKAALQAAAVIGRVFWQGAVAELVDGQPDLDLLERRDFVHAQPDSALAGEREFIVKHALTRQVAYDSLLKAKRAPLHARFAEWLERRGESDEHAPLLAHHFAEAVRPEDVDLAWMGREEEAERLRLKALKWLRQAAELAVSRYEMADGVALYERAVALESDPGRQAELWRRIASANALRFAGDAFWNATERALEIGGPDGELYAELAYQTTRRLGMWRVQPPMDQIEAWIERALAETEEGTIARGRALYARAGFSQDPAATRQLVALAERLDHPVLRAVALEELAKRLWEEGEITEVRDVVDELFSLAPTLPDPDDQTRPLLDVMLMRVRLGDLAGAARTNDLALELSRGLTPHHRMHAAGQTVLLETLCGRWERVRELTHSTERAVADNAETPCAQNQTSLLHCALTAQLLEGDEEARRLETKAEAIGFQGYRFWLDAPRIRLALARGEVAALRPLVDGADFDAIEPPAAYLDALVALQDRDRIEDEAPRWFRPGSYVEPFALRALGVARRDRQLLKDALTCFERLELPWHYQQTAALLR